MDKWIESSYTPEDEKELHTYYSISRENIEKAVLELETTKSFEFVTSFDLIDMLKHKRPREILDAISKKVIKTDIEGVYTVIQAYWNSKED